MYRDVFWRFLVEMGLGGQSTLGVGERFALNYFIRVLKIFTLVTMPPKRAVPETV